ncbi:photosystem II stability/assembly factor HCF136, chloroplastic [Dendrobium catenatum]|uniref:photosystem II stability/assembly factor HCF136, chloroplastic n=1 Tax=Dendrobium catenatum TaxID=906689 RepID=UPI0009F4CF35|nr:photosystem II stability/assembly factor HCF136, chloroplastic [Dendrobium catenatum]
MGSTLLTDSIIFPHLRRTLCTSFFDSTHVGGYRSLRPRFLYKACISSNTDLSDSVARRKIITYTAAISLSLAPIPRVQQPAKSEESVLSEWERVYLPIDPGVVLLDVAFVPDDLNHGFLLGTRQTILETKDGGNAWFPRSIPSAEDEDFNYRFNSISFRGKEGWIVGKPAILLYTSDAGESWERIPLSSQLPGDMVYIKATDEKSAEMVTDQGAIYTTSNRGYNWRAAVQETVSATLNRHAHIFILAESHIPSFIEEFQNIPC